MCPSGGGGRVEWLLKIIIIAHTHTHTHTHTQWCCVPVMNHSLMKPSQWSRGAAVLPFLCTFIFSLFDFICLSLR